MTNHPTRLKQYSDISTNLACISNQKLRQILANGQSMHHGIGGKSVLIYIDEIPVFVKQVPLTELEQLPENFRSTANVFNLPLYYQYGVGSAGFGAWRELATHLMTTNWVITDECPNFPLLYHWRILPNDPSELNVEYWGSLEKYCQYWGNSKEIYHRVESLNQASSHITLFLEYIPQNLYEWLPAQISQGSNTAELAIAFVDKQLKDTNQYMNSHGLSHFDAHFKNILTDGERLYFTDFGLALSQKFELTQIETEFLKHHQQYDNAFASLHLLLGIFSLILNKDPWDIRLRECLPIEQHKLSPIVEKTIKQHMPIALCMDEFLQKLRKESKSTPYPEIQLENLLAISAEKS